MINERRSELNWKLRTLLSLLSYKCLSRPPVPRVREETENKKETQLQSHTHTWFPRSIIRFTFSNNVVPVYSLLILLHVQGLASVKRFTRSTIAALYPSPKFCQSPRNNKQNTVFNHRVVLVLILTEKWWNAINLLIREKFFSVLDFIQSHLQKQLIVTHIINWTQIVTAWMISLFASFLSSLHSI